MGFFVNSPANSGARLDASSAHDESTTRKCGNFRNFRRALLIRQRKNEMKRAQAPPNRNDDTADKSNKTKEEKE